MTSNLNPPLPDLSGSPPRGARTRSAAGVVFDMDGVLVDSAEAHYEAWCLLGKEVGKPHPREFFQKTFGMHNHQIIPLWLGDSLPAEEVKRLSLLKEALYREVAAATLKPLDGVLDLLHALSGEGFLLAIGSSGTPKNVELAMGVLGVPDLFCAMSTSVDVVQGKPHPEVFLKATEKMGLAPASCAVVEDSPQGVEAALRAGAKAIAITSTREAQQLAAAHLVVHSMRDLSPRCIRALISGEE